MGVCRIPTLLTAAVLVLCRSSIAQEVADTGVSFTADAGFVQTSGNTAVTSLNIGERFRWRTAHSQFNQSFSMVYGRADGLTNASLWRGDLRYTRRVSPTVGLFVVTAFERNTFAGIQRRFEEGVGVDFAAIRTAKDKLDLEAGLSLFQQRATAASGGLDNNFAAGRVAALYAHAFSPKAKFTQQVEAVPNLNNTTDLRVNSESALIAPLSSMVAIKLTYLIRFDNLPELGLRKTDRIFTSGLQFSL